MPSSRYYTRSLWHRFACSLGNGLKVTNVADDADNIFPTAKRKCVFPFKQDDVGILKKIYEMKQQKEKMRKTLSDVYERSTERMLSTNLSSICQSIEFESAHYSGNWPMLSFHFGAHFVRRVCCHFPFHSPPPQNCNIFVVVVEIDIYRSFGKGSRHRFPPFAQLVAVYARRVGGNVGRRSASR